MPCLRQMIQGRRDATVKSNYVLVDYENVQPAAMERLKAPGVQLLLFLGATQTKLPVEFVQALQQLGERCRIIRCSASGPNALDFHIALYCGEIIANDGEAYLHIVSRDKGFDPLVAHLKERKIRAQRAASLDQIPFLNVAPTIAMEERISAVIEHFRKGPTKPRSLKTLASTVASVFQKKLSDEEVQGIVDEMRKRKLVALNGTKLEYAIDPS